MFAFLLLEKDGESVSARLVLTNIYGVLRNKGSPNLRAAYKRKQLIVRANQNEWPAEERRSNPDRPTIEPTRPPGYLLLIASTFYARRSARRTGRAINFQSERVSPLQPQK